MENYPPMTWRQRFCFYLLGILAISFLILCLYERKTSGKHKSVEYEVEERFSIDEFVIESKNTVVEPTHLLLSPFIKSEDIQQGKEIAKVKGHPGLELVPSYSGFLTVDAASNSNIFFWFFPAMNGDKRSAIILWLQGGPGQSALFAVFNSNGPYRINSDLKITKNPFTWCEPFNVLYLDNPVGTGFSFSNEDGYSKTQEEVAKHLYSALSQFLELFQEYQENPLFISGEGYGAKYAVTLANMIHSAARHTPINLVGITLENPLLSIEVMFDYGHYLHKMGLINDPLFREAEYHLKQASQDVDKKLWSEAMNHIEKVFGTAYGYHPREEEEITPIDNDVLREKNEYKAYDHYVTFINEIEIRRAIHVGRLKFMNGRLAYQALRNEVPKSIEKNLSIVMDNYKVLFYGGSRDKKIPYPLALKVLYTVTWKYFDDYQQSKLMIWKINPNDHNYVGYFRQATNFIEILIKDCGHVVAHDQPEAAFDMISRFITNRNFNIEDL